MSSAGRAENHAVLDPSLHLETCAALNHHQPIACVCRSFWLSAVSRASSSNQSAQLPFSFFFQPSFLSTCHSGYAFSPALAPGLALTPRLHSFTLSVSPFSSFLQLRRCCLRVVPSSIAGCALVVSSRLLICHSVRPVRPAASCSLWNPCITTYTSQNESEPVVFSPRVQDQLAVCFIATFIGQGTLPFTLFRRLLSTAVINT